VTFQQALQRQQFLFRLAGVDRDFSAGAFRRLTDLLSLLLAALVKLGGDTSGTGHSLTDPEPEPSAFATGLILLAMGLFATENPLLSGFAAGMALCYDPRARRNVLAGDVGRLRI